MRNRFISLCFAGVALASAAVPAAAQPTAAPQVAITADQAASLIARLDALERRNSELEREVQALKAQTVAQIAPRKDAPAATVAIPNGRPTIASADGKFTAAFRGVFQLDGARFDQDAPGPLASDFRRGSLGDAGEADRARDLADGTNFRRARIGVEGKAFGDWDYGFLYDFAGSGVEGAGSVNQAWVQYSGLKLAKLKVGAFAPPAGIDDATSTNGSAFMERAAVAEMVRGMAGADARVGAGVLANGERWNVSAVVTGNTVGQQSFDEQLGLVARAAFVPIKTKSGLVHLGVNTSQVIHPAASGPDVGPAGAVTPVRLRERMENRVEGTRLVDTGSIDADGASAWGLEAAAQYKAFTVQSEYFHIGVERRNSAVADPEFSGWYLQGTWTLTGQPRRYAPATASFDAPKVEKPFDPKKGQWGIWEIAARYSDLDLNAMAGAPGSTPKAGAVRGGEQRIATLGLNWQPNNTVRFQFNVHDVEVDRLSPGGTAFGAGALTPPAGAQIGQSLRIWSARAQYAF